MWRPSESSLDEGRDTCNVLSATCHVLSPTCDVAPWHVALSTWHLARSTLHVSGPSPPRRLHERIEQRPELTRFPEILRVPLDADAEPGIRLLDRFDDAVGGSRTDDEAFASPADRLVM